MEDDRQRSLLILEASPDLDSGDSWLPIAIQRYFQESPYKSVSMFALSGTKYLKQRVS